MGIKDFHANTRHYVTPVHISKYRGCRVGCDASSWLFKGLTPYAYEVATNSMPWAGREDPPWVTYAMRIIYMLKDAGVEPVVRRSALFPCPSDGPRAVSRPHPRSLLSLHPRWCSMGAATPPRRPPV